MKCTWLLVLFAAVLTASGSEVAPPRRTVEPRDFFLYGCVREYARAHAMPLYDSSTGDAVEYGGMGYAEMNRLYAAAKAFALTLRAPDLKDADHGGVPVLAQCLEESRSARVGALMQRKRNAKE